MPQADGTIVIDTEINADGAKAGSKEIEAAVRRMAASVNNLGAKSKTALNKQVDSFAKLNQEYAAQAQKVEELKRKVFKNYQDTLVPHNSDRVAVLDNLLKRLEINQDDIIVIKKIYTDKKEESKSIS